MCDGIRNCLATPIEEQIFRHKKHWRYVSEHTVNYWAQSFMNDLEHFTQNHATMQCYKLGLGLEQFKMITLDPNFKKLDPHMIWKVFRQ